MTTFRTMAIEVLTKTFSDGQYAKRPLSSPGQMDLFGGKSTSGAQRDLFASKPKSKHPEKTWTEEDEKKHPRDESGKFTFLNAGTGERSKAVHDALDSHHTIDPEMVGMMFNVVHHSQHGDLKKAIDAKRPDLAGETEKHEGEHEAANQKPDVNLDALQKAILERIAPNGTSLGDLRHEFGYKSVDKLDPLSNPVNKIVADLVKSGHLKTRGSGFGDPIIEKTGKPFDEPKLAKPADWDSLPKEAHEGFENHVLSPLRAQMKSFDDIANNPKLGQRYAWEAASKNGIKPGDPHGGSEGLSRWTEHAKGAGIDNAAEIVANHSELNDLQKRLDAHRGWGSEKAGKTDDHFQGDRIRLTGKAKTKHGGEFEEFEFMEGHRKGEMGLRPTKAQSNVSADAKKSERESQQDGFRKLHEVTAATKPSVAVPGQQRGLFNVDHAGQKKLFDFVAPGKNPKAAEPQPAGLLDDVKPIKQVESLPGQKSLLDAASSALSKAGLHQGGEKDNHPVAGEFDKWTTLARNMVDRFHPNQIGFGETKDAFHKELSDLDWDQRKPIAKHLKKIGAIQSIPMDLSSQALSDAIRATVKTEKSKHEWKPGAMSKNTEPFTESAWYKSLSGKKVT